MKRFSPKLKFLTRHTYAKTNRNRLTQFRTFKLVRAKFQRIIRNQKRARRARHYVYRHAKREFRGLCIFRNRNLWVLRRSRRRLFMRRRSRAMTSTQRLRKERLRQLMKLVYQLARKKKRKFTSPTNAPTHRTPPQIVPKKTNSTYTPPGALNRQLLTQPTPILPQFPRFKHQPGPLHSARPRFPVRYDINRRQPPTLDFRPANKPRSMPPRKGK